MASKRCRFAASRKAAGYSQEQLAERLGVERSTVARWEAGETAPQPWLRPSIADALGVSLTMISELLIEIDSEKVPPETGIGHEVSDDPMRPRTLLEWRLPVTASAAHGNTKVPDLDAQAGVFVPVIVNGRPVLVSLDEDTDATDWDAMSPLNRRSALSYGLAAAAASMFPLDDAARALYKPVAPRPLSALPQASWATAIYDAVLDPMNAARRATAALEGGAHNLSALRLMVDRAMQVSLSSDYGALEQSLPNLIGRAEAATMQAGGDERDARRVLSDVYAVAGWMLIKADSPVGAWIAAQRAVQAAEDADDVLRIGAATRCLAEVHMRANGFEEATRTAFLAAVRLESAPREDRHTALSLRGAALLSAAAASARRGDSREAHAALKAAAACAAELGQDVSDLATVFGPTNVAIHQVAIAIELGDARGAVRHIPEVQLGQMPEALTERRSRFLIDVARSHAQLKDDSAAIDALLQAETIAPDELRHHRLTRELVPQLLMRENRTSELRALAVRCTVVV